MHIEYLPDEDYVVYVKTNNAELRNIEGKMRWIMKKEDGTEYMVRPESARSQDDKQQWTI